MAVNGYPRDLVFLGGAGDGNRTRMASLEGWGSTIELRPRGGGGSSRIRLGRHRVAYRVGGGVTAQRSRRRYGRGPRLLCLPSRRTSVRAEAQRRAAASHVFTPPRLTYSGVWRRRRVCVGGRPAPRARGNRRASASPSPRVSLADPLGRGRCRWRMRLAARSHPAPPGGSGACGGFNESLQLGWQWVMSRLGRSDPIEIRAAARRWSFRVGGPGSSSRQPKAAAKQVTGP